MTRTRREIEPVELVGWQDVADKLQRSVRDAQAFVEENPTFPLIRNGRGSPVRASARRVEAWLEGYHAAYAQWLKHQSSQAAELVFTKYFRFVYRPPEPPEVADIRGRDDRTP